MIHNNFFMSKIISFCNFNVNMQKKYSDIKHPR